MALEPLPTGLAKRRAVRAMFDRIAPRYDRMNRLLTAGLDQRWRRLTLDAVRLGPGDRLLDLACGTGDLAELAGRRGARVVALDLSREMLRGLRRRGVPAAAVHGDAAALPLASASIDALTCGFALRNFVSLEDVLDEAARVLVPGGRVALLEVDRPGSPLLRGLHSVYFDRVVPRVGALLSEAEAYRYLPRSTAYLPPTDDLVRLLADGGFEGVQVRPLLLGAARILAAVRR